MKLDNHHVMGSRCEFIKNLHIKKLMQDMFLTMNLGIWQTLHSSTRRFSVMKPGEEGISYQNQNTVGIVVSSCRLKEDTTLGHTFHAGKVFHNIKQD